MNKARIDYIQSGKLKQNAFIERFNRSLKGEALGLHLLRSFSELRQAAERWLIQHNKKRPHDSLGGLPLCCLCFCQPERFHLGDGNRIGDPAQSQNILSDACPQACRCAQAEEIDARCCGGLLGKVPNPDRLSVRLR